MPCKLVFTVYRQNIFFWKQLFSNWRFHCLWCFAFKILTKRFWFKFQNLMQRFHNVKRVQKNQLSKSVNNSEFILNYEHILIMRVEQCEEWTDWKIWHHHLSCPIFGNWQHKEKSSSSRRTEEAKAFLWLWYFGCCSHGKIFK